MKWIKDLVTDNEGDFEIVSVMAAIACAVLCGLAIYTVVYRGSDFEMQDFGIAVAAIIGGGGAGYHFKSNQYSRYNRRNDYGRNDYGRDDYRGSRRTEDIDPDV